ncbi:hypothetical protein Tco_1036752 [Tanacetum coccineum]
MATCHHLSGATWRKHCSPTVGQPPSDHRSTVVNDGSQRRSTAAVNDGAYGIAEGSTMAFRSLGGYWARLFKKVRVGLKSMAVDSYSYFMTLLYYVVIIGGCLREQLTFHNTAENDHEKLIDSQMNNMIRNRNAKFAAFQKEIDTLKSTLFKNVKENESLMTTIDILKKQTNEKEDKYIEEAIDLEKQKKELENIVYKVG